MYFCILLHSLDYSVLFLFLLIHSDLYLATKITNEPNFYTFKLLWFPIAFFKYIK